MSNKEKKGAKSKVFLIVIVTIAGIILVAAAAAGIYAWRFTSATGKITVKKINITDVPDGEHKGQFKVYHDSATVEVAVQDGRITGITLVKTDLDKKNAQKVIDRVIEGQSLQVDTVSGATVSSKTVLKAIENALGNP